MALGDPAARQAAARRVAQAAGAEDFLVLVHDTAAGAMLPAPGFPRTLRGGATWRKFIADGQREGRRSATVEMPPGIERPALAIVSHGIALVLLGGAPREAEVDKIEFVLPLLAAALRAEARVDSAAAEVAQAKAATDRALILAGALDNARAESTKLNAELREEHRRKDEFLAMLCHELRNPLAPLVISLEMLRRPGVGAAQSSRSLEIAARQARQLARLVDDLLDVSRVSRGRIELRREPLELAAVIADAVETSRPLLESRRHAIALRLPDEPLMVNADAVRLAQILANLLHNAAKYTDPGGRIEVHVSRDGDEAVMAVSDTGIGISEATLPHVFDLFMQAPVALGRSQGGLGIGLTLVRALVELHGGRVSAESEGVGKGARFTVRLPLLARPVLDDRQRRDPMIPAARPLRVLIVDDNQDAAESLADVAGMMGHHAEVAHTGLTALQIAADGNFDLILLDIGLPEMDGYEVARRLRPIVEREARIVAVTGYGTDEDKRRSREAGFDEHVVKPLMPEVFHELLAGASARRPPLEVSGPALGTAR